jgi:hypothetical protein
MRVDRAGAEGAAAGAGGLAAWAAGWWAATGARGALLLGAGLAGALGGGCVDSDKVGGQDGEEGDDGAPDGGGDGGGDGSDGGDGADGGDGSDGGDGGDGGGEIDPVDREGRGTRGCAWAESETPSEVMSTASWQGELGPAVTDCATCLYDFTVTWTIFERTGSGGCDSRPDSEVQVYAVAADWEGLGPTVLRENDAGVLEPVAPASETTSSLRWVVGAENVPFDGPDGRVLYATDLEEIDVGFTD